MSVRLLANPTAETGAKVRRRFDGLLAAIQRHRQRVVDLGAALDHFRKVVRSYRPGLFHAADISGLPRTNNALEQLFGSQRYHERRATGRKTASPGAVLRGGAGSWPASARGRRSCPDAILAGSTAQGGKTCADPSTTGDKPASCDPDAYLTALERQAQQPTLPS